MLIVKICSDSPQRPSVWRSDLPPELDALIMRCLEKDPSKRPASCTEVAAALGPMRHLTSVIAGTRLSAPGPAPAHAGSNIRPRSARDDSPNAFANTMATPPESKRAQTPGPATVAAAGLPRQGTSRTPLLAGIAIVTTAILGGGVWYASQQSVEPPAVVETEPAPEVEATPAPPSEHVTLIVSPAEAVALLDGRPVHPDRDGNLLVPVVDDDSSLHELRVEYRGFRTHIEDLRLSYAQRVVISLDPGTGEEDLRASAVGAPPETSPSGTGTRPRHTPGSTTGTSTNASSPPPTGESPEATTSTATGSAREPDPPPATREPSTPAVPDGVVAPPPAAGLKRRPSGSR